MIYITVVTPNKSFQTASLDDKVEKGQEVRHALAYFGLRLTDCLEIHNSQQILWDGSTVTIISFEVQNCAKIVNIILT